MRGRLLAAAALVGLLMGCVTASAGGSLDAGPVQVVVQDARGASCDEPIAGWCLANATLSDDPRGDYVDASQHVSYVGVGTDWGLLPPGPRSALPDESVAARGEDGHVPNPVVPLVAENWAQSPLGPGLPGIFMMFISPDNVTFQYNVVDGSSPDHPVKWNTFEVDWAHDGYGVSYDQVGPVGAPWDGDTDGDLHAAARANCIGPRDTDECRASTNSTTDQVTQSTPDADLGFEFHSVQVTTNASRLESLAASIPGAYAPVRYDPYQATPAPSRLETDPGVSGLPQVAPRAAPSAPATAPRASPDAPLHLSAGETSLVAQHPSAAALVTVFAAAAFAVAASALYSRFQTRQDALVSETRRRILEEVAARPGVSPAEIGHRVGLTRNAILHHVRVLERMRLVAIERVEGKVLLHLSGQRLDARDALAQRTKARGLLLDALRAAPEGLTSAELAKAFPHVPRRTLDHSLTRLAEDGLAAQVGEGRRGRRWALRAG